MWKSAEYPCAEVLVLILSLILVMDEVDYRLYFWLALGISHEINSALPKIQTFWQRSVFSQKIT